ncbi:MAG: hypothetical protein FJ139_08380 [Deltaproteobacteria bacterium]|nr:hypothetical protein [Deltaproteobacteria bacterium]
MSKQVAVSFEDNLVKVVFASSEKGKTVLQKTFILKDDEFDSFLKTTRLQNITVVCHFKKFYSDIVSAPPAKDVYLKKIVETEITKKFPELKDFSYFYTVLREKSPEDKGLRDVFFFAVENQELSDIYERFNRYGKTVQSIYPDLLTFTHHIQSGDGARTKTLLTVALSETDRTLFLIHHGEIRFIRVIPYMGGDISDTDIDIMNMTVSYCRQQIRLNPEQIILINPAKKEETGSLKTLIPAVPIDYPSNVFAPEETLRNFLAPVSAILYGETLKKDNLLPQKYRTLYIQKRIAAYSIIFFLLFSLIGLSYSLINLSEIVQIKDKIETLRKEFTSVASITSNYERESARMQQLMPLITITNEARSTPDIQRALASMQFLPMEHIAIHNVQLNVKQGALRIQIVGAASAKNFEDMHNSFQKLLKNFNSIPGMSVISKRIDLKNGNFEVDVESKTI